MTTKGLSMKFKDWIAPVLSVLVPLTAGGIHMEVKVAENATINAAILQRLERIERTLDTQRVAALRLDGKTYNDSSDDME